MDKELHHDIVKLCLKGDRKAQYDLYRLYSKAMFNICYRMLNNKMEAEDMLQEVFSETFRQLGRFRFDSTIGAWIKRITINKCINHIQKRKIDLNFVEESGFPVIRDEQDEPDENLSLSVNRVREAMGKLPDGSRMVFSLYLFEGYDHEEISQILNISESTSKTQFMRAKQKVRELLKTNVS